MKLSIVRTDKKRAVHLNVKALEWLIGRIQTDTKAGEIESLRARIARFGDTGMSVQDAIIAQIHPCVVMKKTDNGRLEVASYNDVALLHVGNLLKHSDIDAVKQAAETLPMTLAAMTGADGRSVEILVAVSQKDGVAPASEAEADRFYQAAHDASYAVYRGLLPYAPDHQRVSCRTSFRMTLDAAPYYQPKATPLTVDVSLATARTTEPDDEAPSTTGQEPDYPLYATYEQMYKRAAETAYEETLEVIESQRMEAYLTELARQLCLMDVPEEEAFLHIRNHHVYKQTYNEDTFRSIVSAVYAEEKPRPFAEGDPVSRDTRRLINHLNTRYQLRYNRVMGYTEYRPNNTYMQDWRPCDEQAVNSMTIEARLANLEVRDKDVRRYVHSNMIRTCDPILDYLARVSDKWDKETDHIARLARCVPCNIPQWEQWFKKWFVAMVAQWMSPLQEYGNQVVPMLISPQGDGKTTFCRMLLPKELRWGFLENLDVSGKRETLQAMHNFLLINLDEFNQISPKLQEGFLKNVIQLPNVKIKRPYGKHVEEFQRFASFIATTNEANILTDPTGSRRFICVPLTAPIDTSYKPNYEALYGQAYHIVMRHQMEWWFNAEEVQQIIAHNRQFMQAPPAIQYFHQYFEPVDDETQGEWLTPTAIFDQLRSVAGNGLKASGVATFGRFLANIPGIRQKRTNYGKCYLVRRC